MSLTLVVPELLWPRQVMQDTLFDADFPALQTLLGFGRRLASAHHSPDDWWSVYFGVESGEWAAAPLRLAAHGAEIDDATWLCADPVHLHVDRHGTTLKEPSALDIDAEAATGLHAAVAPLFAEVGELAMTAPTQWHLRLDTEAPDVPARLDAIVGRSALALLPDGEAGRRWRQLITEAQMCLHAHPVNAAREARGLPTVNGIALWGAGRKPALRATHAALVMNDEPIVAGAARLAGLTTQAVPQRLNETSGECLAHLTLLHAPALAHDALAWREALQRLEENWLSPALAALRGGELDRIELYGFGDDRQVSIAMTAFDRYRFWRKPRRLESL